LNTAAGKQPWDTSVKALVPFPDVLSMMSQKLDWTQKVGDAFLAQQGEVMDTVQKLRKRASEAGNLKSTEQQKVIVEREVIRIEPASPSVVYVPVYDPRWVYGPWWWPYYPPYVVYPYPVGVAIAPGYIWFGTGLFVGSYWGSWGYWGWHNHTYYVNRYYYPHGGHGGAVGAAFAGSPGGSGSGAAGGAFAAQPWRHDPSHRRGVAYRDPATRERFGQQANRAAVENRRSFRGYEGNWIDRGARSGRPDSATGGAGRTGRPDTVAGGTGRPGAAAGRPDSVSGRTDAAGRRDAVAGRAVRPDSLNRREAQSARAGRPDAGLSRQASGQQAPGRASERSAVERSRPGQVFEGIGRGSEVQRQSNWGRESLNAARAGGGTVGEAIRGGASGGAGRGAAGGGFGGHGMRGGHR
jgi:hypothetical protein